LGERLTAYRDRLNRALKEQGIEERVEGLEITCYRSGKPEFPPEEEFKLSLGDPGRVRSCEAQTNKTYKGYARLDENLAPGQKLVEEMLNRMSMELKELLQPYPEYPSVGISASIVSYDDGYTYCYQRWCLYRYEPPWYYGFYWYVCVPSPYGGCWCYWTDEACAPVWVG
jgi:hypothetical protein